MTNPTKLDLYALEARAKLTASMVVGPSSMSVSPFEVLWLIEAARERDALKAALEDSAPPDLDALGALRKTAKNLRLLRDVYGMPCKEAELEFIAASTPHNVLALFAERDALKASLSDDGLERGLAGVMMDVLWPEFGGNHRDAEFWHEAAEIVQFVIKTIRARAALRSQSPKEPTT